MKIYKKIPVKLEEEIVAVMKKENKNKTSARYYTYDNIEKLLFAANITASWQSIADSIVNLINDGKLTINVDYVDRFKEFIAFGKVSLKKL